MKRTLTLFSLLMPAFSFAQSDSSSGAGIIGLLVGIGICLIVFLALRQVVLWYWKIDAIIINQEAQLKAQQATNNLLSEYINHLKDSKEL